MLVEEELARLSPDRDMLLTVGVFDGVHLGHKRLISQLVARARGHDLLSGVVTFRQHPIEFLSPDTRLPYLTNLAEKTNLLKNEGVDTVVAVSFTQELAELSARQFLSLLKKHLRMRGLVVGPDFALGRAREGNASALHKLGREMGFSVAVIPIVKANGEVVSSTVIRQALAEGDMKRVATLLERLFSLKGRVISGAGRGLKLGFPTANLEVDSKQALPPEGVYATWAYVDNEIRPSMTSIGRRPTFDGNKLTIETYILDYRGNLYGRELRIDFVERLREEKRFDSVEGLKRQIAEDIERGRAILNAQLKH